MAGLWGRAIAEVAKLPKDGQEAMAAIMLEELASDKRWAEAFAKSADKLASLADQARREFEAGKTTPLEPLEE
jgi:hypothetical protein